MDIVTEIVDHDCFLNTITLFVLCCELSSQVGMQDGRYVVQPPNVLVFSNIPPEPTHILQ